MAITQFNVYSSYDSGSPVLTGQAGSVVSLFDAILVDGYGVGESFKSGSGWIRPMLSSGSTGAWTQPSGSGCTLFVNDNALGPAGAREAYCRGWETFVTISVPLGTGYGPFPLATQGTAPVTGSVILRKSNTLDFTPRPWVAYVDAYNVYLFTVTGDTSLAYRGLCFGDISSSFPYAEPKKCTIFGDRDQNQATGGTTNGMYLDEFYQPSNLIPSYWIQRALYGRNTPQQCGRVGDMGKTAAGTNPASIQGNFLTPNASNNALYLSRLYVTNVITSTVIFRGTMRGVWHLCHPSTNFFDGQIISGSNSLSGRTFQIVKVGSNTGMWAMEISNTVEAN